LAHPVESLDDLNHIPFAEHGDASEQHKSIKHRVGIFREFIGFDLTGLKTLDIGAPNRFGEVLGIRDNTTLSDLNKSLEAPDSGYDLILCSEIIEHVMNPLYMMQRIYELLRPGGICILSTPLHSWNSGVCFTSPHHFTEYRPDRISRMFVYVGFDLVRFRKYQMWDWSFVFWGVRPLLRVLFHRNQLWMLRKPHD